jgi:hypothetical protein
MAALYWNDTASIKTARPRLAFFNQFRSRYRHAIGRKNNHLSHAMAPARRHHEYRRVDASLRAQKLARMLKHAWQLSFIRTVVTQNQSERAAFTECYASPEKIGVSITGER